VLSRQVLSRGVWSRVVLWNAALPCAVLSSGVKSASCQDLFLFLSTSNKAPRRVEHELTRQRKWDKQATQEYMRHFNALKLDKLTSDPR